MTDRPVFYRDMVCEHRISAVILGYLCRFWIEQHEVHEKTGLLRTSTEADATTDVARLQRLVLEKHTQHPPVNAMELAKMLADNLEHCNSVEVTKTGSNDAAGCGAAVHKNWP